jgi:hypothetical protein
MTKKIKLWQVAIMIFMFGCEEKMHLIGVKPGTGIVQGGELIEIRGTGFKSGINVYFDDVEAPSVIVEGDSILHVTTPAADQRKTVDIHVTTDDGQHLVLKKAFTYVEVQQWTPWKVFGKKRKKRK